MERKQVSAKKLKERCEILEKMIVSISEIYFDPQTTNDQRKLLETTLGAAIFYLPQGEDYWTGKISQKAIEALKNNPKVHLTKEHQFPRKIAAKRLLSVAPKLKNNDLSLLKLYEEEYGKFNYVTSKENKAISRYQRDEVFEDIDKAYQLAEIEMVLISKADLSKLRNRR
jgi:hypothetical protein